MLKPFSNMSASFGSVDAMTGALEEPGRGRAVRVLLTIHTPTFLTELGQLARRLARDQRFDPELMFYSRSFAGRTAPALVAESISCIDQFGDVFSENSIEDASFFAYLTRGTASVLRRISLYDLLYEIVSVAWRRRQIVKILRHRAIGLVVLGGDMTGYDTSAFVDACHQLDIPVAIVPSTMSNGLEQAEVYSGDPRHSLGPWLNRLLARWHPRWLYIHHGRPVLRERGARAFALEWLGMAPPLPWIFNSGKADAITVESEAMRDYYVQAGLPAQRLVITGSPSDDAIAGILPEVEARKSRLLQEFGFPVERPLLLTALPPDSLYMIGGRPQCDFKLYSELVRFWIRSIDAVPGVNKLVSLHPSVDPASMRHLETPELRIATARTAELVPLCDLYIASVSSTIRWAVACGKPVINYDVYRYHYTDYVGLKGVVTVEEQDDFVEVLRRMATDSDFRSEVAALQRMDAPRWGNLDGKAGERIVALLLKMMKTKRI